MTWALVAISGASITVSSRFDYYLDRCYLSTLPRPGQMTLLCRSLFVRARPFALSGLRVTSAMFLAA
jgi:hypothetical protein